MTSTEALRAVEPSGGKIKVVVARTRDDFRKVWDVRYRSYVDFGHITAGDFEKIRDWRDAVTTTFLALDADTGDAMGTIRVLIGPVEDYEGRTYIEPHLSASERAGELTKLAVLPEFQKRTGRQSVFLHLVNALYRFLADGELESLYLVTIDENAQIYERLGFSRIFGPVTFAGYPRDHFVLRATRESDILTRHAQLSRWLDSGSRR